MSFDEIFVIVCSESCQNDYISIKRTTFLSPDRTIGTKFREFELKRKRFTYKKPDDVVSKMAAIFLVPSVVIGGQSLTPFVSPYLQGEAWQLSRAVFPFSENNDVTKSISSNCISMPAKRQSFPSNSFVKHILGRRWFRWPWKSIDESHKCGRP